MLAQGAGLMAKMTKRRNWTIGVLVAVGAVGASFLIRWPINAAQPDSQSASVKDKPAGSPSSTVRVTTMNPSTGGVARRTSLPCSAHWHDYADLYAKVSGYLDELKVDIGSRVKQGDVLAKIAVPELESDIEHAAATLEQSLAAVRQADARKKSAITGRQVAAATVAKADADLERWNAERTFRDKEHQRFTALNKSNSVQAAIVDEKLFQLQTVEAGFRAGEAAVLTAKEQLAAAEAQIELAEADLGVAQAQARVAKATLNKTRLYASFAEIVSPYDGVITARNFHRGEFIRAADKGSMQALLMVGRTDVIRVVVHIPDRDVPFAHAGDAVKIEFDSLPGRSFTGTLSRVSHSEDRATRSMRAEADLPNEDGLIVDQMYGRMQIELEPAAKTLTLPSYCLVGDLAQGRGQVYVVRGGVVKLQPVSVGAHDGVKVEIVDGLSTTDNVVVRPPAGLSDGTSVSAEKSTEPTKS
jgi:RND family efflux transporter MFP subunit